MWIFEWEIWRKIKIKQNGGFKAYSFLHNSVHWNPVWGANSGQGIYGSHLIFPDFWQNFSSKSLHQLWTIKCKKKKKKLMKAIYQLFKFYIFLWLHRSVLCGSHHIDDQPPKIWIFTFVRKSMERTTGNVTSGTSSPRSLLCSANPTTYGNVKFYISKLLTFLPWLAQIVISQKSNLKLSNDKRTTLQ